MDGEAKHVDHRNKEDCAIGDAKETRAGTHGRPGGSMRATEQAACSTHEKRGDAPGGMLDKQRQERSDKKGEAEQRHWRLNRRIESDKREPHATNVHALPRARDRRGRRHHGARHGERMHRCAKRIDDGAQRQQSRKHREETEESHRRRSHRQNLDVDDLGVVDEGIASGLIRRAVAVIARRRRLVASTRRRRIRTSGIRVNWEAHPHHHAARGGAHRQLRRLREKIRTDAQRRWIDHRQRRQTISTTGVLDDVHLGA